MADIHNDGRDPGTLGERLAHYGDATGRGQENDTELGNVVEKLAINGDTAARGDDLDRMTRLAESLAQSDKLAMPHGKDQAPATNRGRARQHCVCRDASEPFVDEMLVCLAAAERLRITVAGIAIERLHEDEVTRRQPLRQRRQVKQAVEEALGPRRPDGEHTSSGRSNSVL